MGRYSLKTFGCKVNQCDSDRLAALFLSLGLEPSADIEDAALCVINTCTVTAVSDSKCLKAARSIRRSNPNTYLVVTGCFARRDRGRILATGCVDAVLDAEDEDGWMSCLFEAGLIDHDLADACREEGPAPLTRTRAFIKVQDGCDAYCSYCIVPHVRGTPRSESVEEVCRAASVLVTQGVKEIVLAGIHLGRYGHPGGNATLEDLLNRLLDETDVKRIRLSSIEVNEITDGLLSTFARTSRIQRHFHIPLQSGDDGVLAAMNRHYGADDFRKMADRIREIDPQTGISTDIMVGFPGESDEAFSNTCSLIEEVHFSRLHVFKFSPRPGTAAHSRQDGVSANVAAARSNRVMALGDELADEFARSSVGATCDVLIESTRDRDTGHLAGFASNYLRVIVRDATDHIVNEIVPVRIEETCGAKAVGRLVHDAKVAV